MIKYIIINETDLILFYLVKKRNWIFKMYYYLGNN